MTKRETWAHLHLPKLKAWREGSDDDRVISCKVPGTHGIEYVSSIALDNARFFVSEAGRQRTLREGSRNVHAWVVGTSLGEISQMSVLGLTLVGARKAIYDPWKGRDFVDSETLMPVESMTRAYLIGKDVYYL